jgi:hypothetical protein
MLGGIEITPITRRHAQEMLASPDRAAPDTGLSE